MATDTPKSVAFKEEAGSSEQAGITSEALKDIFDQYDSGENESSEESGSEEDSADSYGLHDYDSLASDLDSPRLGEGTTHAEVPKGMSHEDLVALLETTTAKYNALVSHNNDLQRRCRNYFLEKDMMDLVNADENNNIVSADAAGVTKAFQSVAALADQLRSMNTYYDAAVTDSRQRLQERHDKAAQVKQLYNEFKREIAKESVHSQTLKPVSMKTIVQLEMEETRLDAELWEMRLKNASRRKRFAQLEKALAKREEMKNGLHLIDFEQLKIENQAYSEKIDERGDEIQKIRKKINNTVHIVSHVKEKLAFLQSQHDSLEKKKQELEAVVNEERDSLGQLKTHRDKLRTENQKLKSKSGLIGNDELLKDFQKHKEQLEEAERRLADLQATHRHLTRGIPAYEDANSTPRNRFDEASK